MSRIKSLFPWMVVGFVLLIYGYHFSDIPFFGMVGPSDGVESAYRMASQGFLGIFSNSQNLHSPFFDLLLSGVFKCFGFGVVTAKVTTFAIALLVVLFTFFVLRRLFGVDHLPVWQVVLGIKLIPVFYIASKALRPDILMALWMIVSYYFLVRWRSQKALRWLFLGSVVHGLMFMTQMYGFPIVLVWGVEWLRRRDWRSALLSLLIMVMVMFPYLGWVAFNWQSLGVVFHDSAYWALKMKMYFGSRTNGLIVICLIVGLYYYWKRPKTDEQKEAQEDVAIFSAAYLSQFLVLPTPHELYMVGLIPFLMIVGNGIRVKAGFLTKLILVLFVVINMLGLFAYISKHQPYEYESYSKVLHDVSAVSGVGYVLGSSSAAPLFRDVSFKAVDSFDRMSDTIFRSLVNGASAIVIQPALESVMTPKQKEYIMSNRRLVKSIWVPDESVLGKKRMNLIRIYQ